MQLKIKSGSVTIRKNGHMRSLWIEYPRINNSEDILAVVFNRDEVNRRFKLPVISADHKGIEIKLPAFLTGMFYLEIEDGDQSFFRQIAIQ